MADDGRRSTAARAATGCRWPRPARSTGPLALDIAPGALSSPGSACRSAACAPGRSVDVGPPQQVQVRLSRSGPPQPEAVRGFGRAGTRLTSTRTTVPRTIGRVLRVPRPGMILLLRMQPGPGAHPHRAVLFILGDVLGGRCGPGRRSLHSNLAPACAADPPWATALRAADRRRSSGRCAGEREWRRGPAPNPASIVPNRSRHRRRTGPRPRHGRRLTKPWICSTATALAFSAGWTRRTSERGAPAIAREAELGQPLVGPPGHDRLTGRVARRVVIKAAFRARLGIATGPDAQITSVDRMAVGDGILQPPASRAGHRHRAALGQGVVEAAPAAAVCSLQAQVRQRADRLGGQQGIAEFEQGVSAAGKHPYKSVRKARRAARSGAGMLPSLPEPPAVATSADNHSTSG